VQIFPNFFQRPYLGILGYFSGWWQLKYFLFSPLFGDYSHFDEYFSNGLKPPTSFLILQHGMKITFFHHHLGAVFFWFTFSKSANGLGPGDLGF